MLRLLLAVLIVSAALALQVRLGPRGFVTSLACLTPQYFYFGVPSLTPPAPKATNRRLWTPEELALHNGSDAQLPILIASMPCPAPYP